MAVKKYHFSVSFETSETDKSEIKNKFVTALTSWKNEGKIVKVAGVINEILEMETEQVTV